MFLVNLIYFYKLIGFLKKNVFIDKEIIFSVLFKMCLIVFLVINFYRNVYIIK